MIGKITATGGLRTALLLGGLTLWGWCAHHADSQQTGAGDRETKIRILGTPMVTAPPSEPFRIVNLQPPDDSNSQGTIDSTESEPLPKTPWLSAPPLPSPSPPSACVLSPA